MLGRLHAIILMLLLLAGFVPARGAFYASSSPHTFLQNASTQTAGRRTGVRAKGGERLSRPLWPGSRWTERHRSLAVRRGLQFIYRTAREAKNFEQYGSDYLWCFYTLSEALSDREASALARRMGRERARQWRLRHRTLPAGADAGTISDYVFGSDAADSLGVRDERLKEEIRKSAARFGAREYLLFDPRTEAPPLDVPAECDFCHANNLRGATSCRVCKRPLKMRTRYDVWYDALITTYSGEHYGVMLGAKYADVLRWLPAMRPYRGGDRRDDEFYDTVYAITHVVYTLNDYSLYKLNPKWLPQEFAFLKENMPVAVRQSDADMLGEFMDTLRAFGLSTADPLMRSGMEYLLAHQNSDGSWGNTRERDIYLRYHPTWNAVAALSEYAWRAERLSHPELKPLLEKLAAEDGAATVGRAPFAPAKFGSRTKIFARR
jgi:hypothetical protein